ncbi:MAG TPA: crosslink repair DNA glycosylase YcaQ family protein [Gaiellaceae bacterium]
MHTREVSVEEARRIAVRAQFLDGSAADVLSTVRTLGFLQLDPISTVAPPQHLVLWSRLGSRYDPGELDRLLWETRELVEWNAFLWPAEDLPYLRARMRSTTGPWDARRIAYLKENASFRRYVLRELDKRGPLLSRDIETHVGERGHSRWWGSRQMGLMLEVLASRGEVAVVGRRGKQRLWDLADRWYPETERVTPEEAEAYFADKQWRSLGVKLVRGKLLGHPDAADGPVPPARTTFLSPFDRLVHDRDRAYALWGFFYRLEMYVPKAKREYGYYVLPILRGDRVVGRIEPVHDRKAGTLTVLGTWWEGRAYSIEKPLRDLGRWLGARLS